VVERGADGGGIFADGIEEAVIGSDGEEGLAISAASCGSEREPVEALKRAT
jgi:hypothetical protein